MSTSFTLSESTTFTLTHAKHIGAKVATDLKRIQRFYSSPDDSMIGMYEAEIVLLLKHGYLEEVTYGFKLEGKWIEPALKYKASDLSGATAADDDPGRIRPGAKIEGASFTSFLIYTSAWHRLPANDKEAFKKGLPFQRGTGDEPGVHGYLAPDRIYSSGGKALNRSSVRSF